MTDIQYATIEELVNRAQGDKAIDALNWSPDGETCEPWLFDDVVFTAAHLARLEMTVEEVDTLVEQEPTTHYYRTLEALRGRPGGCNFATARLIVAMFYHLAE